MSDLQGKHLHFKTYKGTVPSERFAEVRAMDLKPYERLAVLEMDRAVRYRNQAIDSLRLAQEADDRAKLYREEE